MKPKGDKAQQKQKFSNAFQKLSESISSSKKMIDYK